MWGQVPAYPGVTGGQSRSMCWALQHNYNIMPCLPPAGAVWGQVPAQPGVLGGQPAVPRLWPGCRIAAGRSALCAAAVHARVPRLG